MPQKTRQATTIKRWSSEIEGRYESALVLWTGLTGGLGYPRVC